MLLPFLTKFAGPNWETDHYLLSFHNTVSAHFHAESEQHPLRQWEYASALLATCLWTQLKDRPAAQIAYDVGGAGSPFRHMVAPWFVETYVVDPAFPGSVAIEELSPGPLADAIFSISVLEHVEDPYTFLEACVRHLRPGGLFFLTVDAWDPPVVGAPDTAHFHWMRKRIFDREGIEHVMDTLRQLGCLPFGGIDLEYKGNTLFGSYTFASICMRKED